MRSSISIESQAQKTTLDMLEILDKSTFDVFAVQHCMQNVDALCTNVVDVVWSDMAAGCCTYCRRRLT